MFTLGVPEMAVIFILALVLFGPKKLPELGRTIGKAMTEFRRASNDLKATFEREMQTLERENQSLHQTTRETARELADHVSYGLAPAETVWKSLEAGLDDSATAHETAPVQEQNPALYVGASEVPGAESQPVETVAEAADDAQMSLPGLEGTVPRSARSHETAHETVEVAHETSAESTPDHSIHS